MIPEIRERNFPEYATLHQATVSLSTMGDRTITTQIRVDGSIAPEFGITENGVFKPMELVFRGERFILPTREPQARKDTSTKNSLIDLTFYSWPVYELKRYFFVEMSSTTSGTAIADKYDASLALNLENFVDAFNLVLDHYFNGRIQISLFGQGQGIYSTDPVFFEINYTKLWEVLQKVYEMYNVRWWFDYDSASEIYLIKIGYTADSIDDHDFSYGYKGGLLSFERTVQNDDLVNILLGRGGEKNLPYRYFKRTDPDNPGWTADPDAIPELANIYFDRLHDVNFRWYVRGWMTNPERDRSWEQEGYVYPTYSISPDSPYYFAYQKGATDAKFNPVEYVKDDESIAAHGEVWGALDDNDDIYPTIQGVTVNPYGRIDESVAISQIETDDISAYASAAAVETTIKDMKVSLSGNNVLTHTIYSEPFTIAQGETGNVTYRPFSKETAYPNFVYYDTTRSTLVAEPLSGGSDQPGTPSYDETTGLYAVSGLPAGTYRLKLNLVLRIDSPATVATGTFGIENVVLTTSAANTNAWKPTFDIWVKNLWQTTQGTNESNKDYAERVWGPILGDRLGDEAKIVFSTGAMSISQDYEFVIADYPVPDRTKTINGVPSEWKITVYKSDAEYQATGLYIPNASSAQPLAGDKFFFVGIDMPFQYVEWAEERLNQYKTDNLEGMSEISPTWTLKLDKVRINSLEDEDYGQKLADRLDAGVMIRTTDPRFTHEDILSLYIQSITWTWNEPSKGNPYIVPDVEVILADKVSAVESPISRLENDVDVISQTYVQSGDVEAVVRRVAGALYLKKTGESDSSSSPTTFSSKVTSRNFRKGGIGGAGWGLYEDNSRKFSQSSPATRADVSDEEETIESRTVLEVDRLVVREEMEVNNLVINQISARGGREIISAARIEVTLVRETNDAYVCYFDQKQNSVANLFQVNDVAYGQVWSADNMELRFYKMLVTAVDVNSITLAKAGRYGSGSPQEGDVIVQYGNTTDTRRQYVIVRDVVGGGHDRMLSGLNSVSATGVEYYFAGIETGETPRWFVGDRNNEYAEYKNGQLNIKGRLSVLKSDGTYQSMSDYINQIAINEQSLQAQIDGQIQSWSGDVSPLPIEDEGTVDPATANYPANQWTTDTERLKHMGDIYVNNTSGQGYRYTRQANNGNFYWMRISDEEVALALQRANQALAGVAGMQYLTAALGGSTLVQGGLVLTSLIQLGKTENDVFNVYSGINGTMDANEYGNGIAAWYGGPMTDHEADPTAQNYANSLFRFDGSGYLAGGLLKWGVSNGEAFLNLNGQAVIGGLGGTSLNDIANLLFDVVQYENGHYAVKLRPSAYYNGSLVTIDGMYAEGWVSAGGVSSDSGGSIVAWLKDLLDVDDNLNPSSGQVLMYDGAKWTAGNGGQGSVTGITVGGVPYSPVSGIVALPAYPTTLPASDVYAWAKAASKPSYSFSEITGLQSALDSKADASALAGYIPKGGLSTADGAIAAWGTLTSANGYSPLLHWSSSDGGDWNLAYKSGQISMQLDGLYYQNEGQYRVLDASDIGSTVASQSALSGYLPLTGGTMETGAQITAATNDASNSATYNGGIQLREYSYGGSSVTNDKYHAPGITFHWSQVEANKLWLSTDGNLNWGDNKVWNAGNDGSGSGLDADLLDGLQPSQLDVNTAKTLKGYDNRGVNNPPSWYMSNPGQMSIFTEFAQTGGAISLPNYESRTTFTPWGDASGGRPTQLSLSDSGAFFRTSASDSAWNSWREFAFTDSNVASASKLQTSRTIWGQSFDGTGNVDGLLTLTYASTARATGIEVMSSNSGEASIGFASTNRTVFGRYADRGFIYGSVAGEIMSLLDNGNVGVGVSAPSYKLDVAGDSRTSGKFYIGTTGGYLEVVNVGTQESPSYALRSTLPFYSDSWVSAGGVSDTGGGGSASYLNDLLDVTTTGATNGQALVYNNGTWSPGDVESGTTQFVFAQSETDPGDPSDGGDSTSWTATANVNWITLSKASGSGSDTVSYTVSENTGASSRTGVITIAYQGGSKTLTVTQAGASSIYTEVEYITCDGNQYLDTGLYGDEDTTVTLEFMPTSLSSGQTMSVFGYYNSGTDSLDVFLSYGSGNTRYDSQAVLWSWRANTEYSVTLSPAGASRTYGATTDSESWTASAFTTAGTMMLGYANVGGQFVGRLYSCKIWQGSTLVMDLVPVLNNNTGEYGMYDNIGDDFYASDTGNGFGGPS